MAIARPTSVQGLRAIRWSPYAVGAAVGILSWIAFATLGHGLGVSGPFEELGGMMERSLVPGWADSNGWQRANRPVVDGEWTIVVGIFLGSFWSASLSGQPRHAGVPPIWRRRFGRSASRRLGWAFAGGALMMFGARLARGCTTGHGITGALSFAVSSWAFLVVAFGAAFATAYTLFGSIKGRHARLPR